MSPVIEETKLGDDKNDRYVQGDKEAVTFLKLKHTLL